MTVSKRIESIDILRGIVMIIMCLDHTRDYFQDLQSAGWPMDLETTTPSLFFTRYITHFCAPIFVFLSGVSIFLQSKRKTKKELTVFLLTRGLWLIFLEIFLNNFLWNFDVTYNIVVFQVIWAIGASMVILAGLIHLNKKVLLILGIVIVSGHNLLNEFGYSSIVYVYDGKGAMDFLWYLIHQPGGFEIGENHRFISAGYPMLPWLGVMILGFCLGSLYSKSFDQLRRSKYLIVIGSSALLLFILLRTFNLYGDPQFSFYAQDSFFKSMVSFLRITKYPPSFHFILVTIGVCLISLALLEKFKNRITDFLLVFGRVPLFFYFVHVAVIHVASMLMKPLYGDVMYSTVNNYENFINEQHRYLGTDLLGVYIAWILIIAALYYPCLKYMRYKMNNKDKKWLSYF
jgi:uncharacterized membrane protein